MNLAFFNMSLELIKDMINKNATGDELKKAIFYFEELDGFIHKYHEQNGAHHGKYPFSVNPYIPQ